MPSDASLVIAVLAAGASRRLGRAKQLVPIGGEPLLRRQCRCALDADVGRVVAILGSNAERHRSVLNDLPVDVYVNDEWAEGLAATLRCAVRVAMRVRAALLVLPCDLYRVFPDDLRALDEQWRRAPSRPCVSRWDRFAGPPAVLPAEYYERLLALRGDVGARQLLCDSSGPGPTEVLNPRASFDLDSADDLKSADAWSVATKAAALRGSVRTEAPGARTQPRSILHRPQMPPA